MNNDATYFVYVWKRPDGTPIYVGATNSRRRTNPERANPGRNWLLRPVLDEVGRQNIRYEVHTFPSKEAAVAKEIELIIEYGRVQLGNGTLLNLRAGGQGLESPTAKARAELSERMKGKNNVALRPEVRAKIIEAARRPENIARMSGENNLAKRPEVREKIKASWADPEKRAKRIAAMQGHHVSDETRKKSADRYAAMPADHPLKQTHKKLNSDPAIREKRAATARTPEMREFRAAQMRAIWAKRKAEKS